MVKRYENGLEHGFSYGDKGPPGYKEIDLVEKMLGREADLKTPAWTNNERKQRCSIISRFWAFIVGLVKRK